MKNPIQIEINEWWWKGCFIQKQHHPKLKQYVVFQDNEEQTTIDSCHTMTEAKKLASLNEVVNYKLGVEAFL